MLAACAAACAPVPDGAPHGPLALAPSAFEGPAGQISYSHWAAEGAPRAVILGVHGWGFYGASAFRLAGPFWAARGIEVYAPDLPGFGRNPDRGTWPGTDALVGDLSAMAAAVRAAHPGLPLFVVGHSMGGGLALAAAGEGRLPGVAGIVALAPAVWGGETLPLPFRLSAWAAANVLPERRWTGEGVVRIVPTDNLPLLREIVADPLHLARPASRDFLGLIRLMDRVVAALPAVAVPVLVVTGAQDEVVPEGPIRRAFDALPGPKRYTRVETGWHMLLHDREAARVMALVADWTAEVAP